MSFTLKDVFQFASKDDEHALARALRPGNDLAVRLAALLMLSWNLLCMSSTSHYVLTRHTASQRILRLVSRIAADSSDELRYCAILFLGKHGDFSVADVLHALLKEKDPGIRYAATLALLELECPLSKGYLIKAYGEGDEEYRREFAEEIYSFLGNYRSIKKTFLRGALKDPDPDVRFSAALVLAEQGDSRAIEPLLEFLDAENQEVRGMTVASLAHFDDAMAHDGLLKALDDPVEYVAEWAMFAICDSGQEQLYAKAQPVLQRIAEESESPRLKAVAAQVLDDMKRSALK